MSEESANPQDAPETQSAAPPESFAAEPAKRGKLRQIILFCLLALMLLALAYDYQIARPSVEKAFDQIVQLNDKMNMSANRTPTLNTDIHKTIGRDPARVYTEGQYRVEVFSWTGGLPFKTHDLYAVYFPNGNDMVFMRHYKFALPDDELNPPSAQPSGDDGPDDAALPGDPSGVGMGRPGGGRRGPRGPGAGGPSGPPGDGLDAEEGGRPRRPSVEGEDPAPKSGEAAGEDPAPATPGAEPSTPEPSTPEPSTPEPSTPEPSTPEPSTPEAKPAETAPADVEPETAAGEPKKD